MNTPQPAACNWRDGVACQFPELQETVRSYDGRDLCRAHAPLGAHGKTAQWSKQFVDSKGGEWTDYSGVVFPGKTADFNLVHSLNTTGVKCRDSRFGSEAYLQLGNSTDISKSVFEGTAFLSSPTGNFVCSETIFKGDVQINAGGPGVYADFSNCEFRGEIVLDPIHIYRALTFDGCTFWRAPQLKGKDNELPQQTTFARVKVNRSALQPRDEGSYRHIRNCFHNNRDREFEGKFYRYEKVCQRQTLPWYSVARWISVLYDEVARYGQSFERALLSVAVVQILFGFGYEYASGRLRIPGPIDTEVVAFTLMQIVKPFELLALRTPEGAASAVLHEKVPSGWWLVAMSVQSIVSLVLIALFLFAIRWRYKRE